MKKILLPFEGENYPSECLEFVGRLNELSPVFLTAAFVPEVDYANLWNLSGGVPGASFIAQSADEDKVIERNSALLAEFCRNHSIKNSLHTDRLDFALPSIRKESRFADLLILSSLHFFGNISSDQPNAYLKELLHSSECPVLLLTDRPGLPETIILTYDGSASSVYAIRQFVCLFPELLELPAMLVYIHERREESLPEKILIEELLSQHFTDLRLMKLSMHPQEFFNTWVISQPNPWLVAGAYGRSGISQAFSGSFITGAIREHKIPVFIAHA